MRQKPLIILGLIVIVASAAYYRLATRATTAKASGRLEIVNTPERYCPTQAQIVVTSSINQVLPEHDQTVAVINCRTIEIKSLIGTTADTKIIWLKLPGALADKTSIDSPTDYFQFSPRLGDVNGDNVIDEIDRRLVENTLLSDAAGVIKADIDGDQKISIIDLSLTRINAGVGSERPDGKNWGANESNTLRTSRPGYD